MNKGSVFLNDSNCSHTEPVSTAQYYSNLYLPQSLIVAFSGPHLRQQDRNKNTGRKGDRQQRKTGRDDKERKKGEGQRSQ